MFHGLDIVLCTNCNEQHKIKLREIIGGNAARKSQIVDAGQLGLTLKNRVGKIIVRTPNNSLANNNDFKIGFLVTFSIGIQPCGMR